MTMHQSALAATFAHKILRRDSSIARLREEEKIKKIRYYTPIRHHNLASAIAIALPFVIVRR